MRPGFVDINTDGSERCHQRVDLVDPDACLVMVMAWPFGSTRALATAHDIRR